MNDQLDVVPAAGGVVIRPGRSGEFEVLLVLKRQPQEWRLPKGKIKPGEAPEQTAVREVLEESGVEAEILRPLTEAQHQFTDPRDGRRKVKRTQFFLMRPVGGEPRPIDGRFAQAVWLPVSRAIETLTFDTEKEVVRKAWSAFCSPAQAEN